jgi:hypothetical protein
MAILVVVSKWLFGAQILLMFSLDIKQFLITFEIIPILVD